MSRRRSPRSANASASRVGTCLAAARGVRSGWASRWGTLLAALVATASSGCDVDENDAPQKCGGVLLALGETVHGDTRGGRRDLEPSCFSSSALAAGRERVFYVQPDPHTALDPGRYRVTWDTEAPLAVSVRANCVDEYELACAWDGEELMFSPDPKSEAFRVIVDTMQGGEEGPFTLRVDHVPDPRCGDGVRGAGEQCDDGNGVDWDHCTNDCRLRCGNPVPLPFGASSGATHATSPLVQACGVELTPTLTYVVQPTPRGKFQVELETEEDLILAAGADCAFSTPICADERKIVFHDGVWNPSYIAVAGRTANDFGTFRLQVTFEPSCGNGAVDINETCDDGNTEPGDGCDPTCSIEEGYYCSQATPLSLGALDGTTADGTHVQKYCSYLDGREKFYVFQAAQTGLLVLSLESAGLLAFSVQEGVCDGSFICSDDLGGSGTSSAAVSVTQGSTYTIVVEEREELPEGVAFTLRAQLIPDS
jgi:cysteine-rich repeat protein